ncbi:MAG: FAD-dependent oxidoreductase [Actinomycetota bacterium]
MSGAEAFPDERLLDDSISAASFLGADAVTAPLPSRARIVVIGAGIVGAATAAHLAELGERDVLLLERDRVASGTSWHAAGLLARMRGSHALTELSSYGVEVYRGLEARTGLPLAFNENGSLTLARQPGRVDELKSMGVMARHHDVEAHLLTPDALAGVHPLVSADGVLAALHQPGDAMINPGWGAAAMVKWASDAGVSVREGARITGLKVDDVAGMPRVTGVTTEQGDVEAEVVVLCAGIWTRELAASVGALVPLYAAEHVHVTTGPVRGAVPSMPLIRDLDGYLYVRHHQGCLVVGAFEPDGKPRAMDTIGDDFSFGEFEPDWEHFRPVRENAERAVPTLRDTTYERFLCAPESFTPDVNFCLGETPEVAGLYVGAGFNSQGIIFAPGVGRALAQWIVGGAPAFDASAVDVARFDAAQGDPGYLHERTRESLGRLYAMHWPHIQSEAARGLLHTPLTERLRDAGAFLGEANGWERPMWFARGGQEPEIVYSYRRQNWFDASGEEHRAAREGVAFFDLSSFAKTEVAGPEAAVAVQQVCTADIGALPVGRAVYTLMLNRRGGIEVDGTVLRRGPDRFLVITPTLAQRKTEWIIRRSAAGRDATVTNVTGDIAVLHLAGPGSLDLLQRLTSDDVAGLGRFAARDIQVAGVAGTVLRVSFTGERGYELYVPAGHALAVFERIVEAGKEFDLRLAGLNALDSLRAEVGYRHLGHDIGPADDPFAAGLDRFVAMDAEGGFTGREALEGVSRERRQVLLLLDDPDPVLYHGESVLADGRIVGEVTSAAYGHTLGAACGLAMLEPEVVASIPAGGTSPVTVDVLGTAIPGRVSLEPFRRPKG